jgi:hypothetical protein
MYKMVSQIIYSNALPIKTLFFVPCAIAYLYPSLFAVLGCSLLFWGGGDSPRKRLPPVRSLVEAVRPLCADAQLLRLLNLSALSVSVVCLLLSVSLKLPVLHSSGCLRQMMRA